MAEDLDTMLYTASSNGDATAVQALLERGASANVWVRDPSQSSPNPRTPLYTACFKGFDEVVDILLAHGADVNVRELSYGSSPLHIACLANNLTVVATLLQRGAIVDNTEDHGETPLHYAFSDESCSHVSRLLLKYGANPNAVSRSGHTPLIIACIHGSLEAIQDLLDHGAILEVTKSCSAIQQQAAHLEAVEKLCFPLLRERGASSKVITSSCRFVLHTYYETVKKLNLQLRQLCDQGANLEITTSGNSISQKVLLEAADTFRTHVVGYGPRSLMTPLHYASEFNRPHVVKELLKRGANIHECDFKLWTPLHRACAGGSLCAIKVLLEHGALVDVTMAAMLMPLQCQSEVIDILLEREVNVNAPDLECWTPLHWASGAGRIEAVKLLLDCGAILSSRTADSQTPLHIACRCGRLDVVKELLFRGADARVTDDNGKTAVDFAIEANHQGIIESRKLQMC